jgi:dolichyl-phosphate beta-glucosyltransferase
VVSGRSDIASLSVIVPVLNEEDCIEHFLEQVSRRLDAWGLAWEIVVVDDGSDDGTVVRVENWAAAEPRVRLVRQDHGGKGAAIRSGMLAAQGSWRFMADADLSVAPDDWSVFLDAAREPDAADVIVGSREAPGAERIGETLARHLIGRAFNRLVQVLAIRGLNDTQCGFKLLSAEAAVMLFPHLTVEGFAFDVELLFLARRSGFRIREVGVVWTCRRESRVRVSRGAGAFLDLVRIRWRAWRGRYARLGGASADAHRPEGVELRCENEAAGDR